MHLVGSRDWRSPGIVLVTATVTRVVSAWRYVSAVLDSIRTRLVLLALISTLPLTPKSPLFALALIPGGFRSINWPGSSNRGFSMPLAAAMACQPPFAPSAPPVPPGWLAAMFCKFEFAGASVMGAVPGGAPPRRVTPGGPGAPWANLNSVIFCCESAIPTVARKGRPSAEKISSDSSIESMMPSNTKLPQMKRTLGGMYLVERPLPSLVGVMK